MSGKKKPRVKLVRGLKTDKGTSFDVNPAAIAFVKHGKGLDTPSRKTPPVHDVYFAGAGYMRLGDPEYARLLVEGGLL